MRNSRVPTLIAVLVAVAATSTPLLAANTTSETKAQTLIRQNARSISEFAYPTLQFSRTDYIRGTRYRDGSFNLVYKFHAKSGNSNGYCQLTFSFRRDGKLTQITSGARTWFLPPFTTAKFLVDLIKQKLQKDKDLRNNPTVYNLVRKADAVALMMLILNLKNGHV